jgi:DNA-binding XRE family transcriptional regulator
MTMTREQLKAWREYRGLFQATAAQRVGVSVDTWQSWELGRRPIPAWLELALAGVDAHERTEAGDVSG